MPFDSGNYDSDIYIESFVFQVKDSWFFTIVEVSQSKIHAAIREVLHSTVRT